MDASKITLELTLSEAKIIEKAITNFIPAKENEMITTMLYHRLIKKIYEAK